jgi:hypothetical protein
MCNNCGKSPTTLVTGERSGDSMRHGGFNWEVAGDDYASMAVHGPSSIARMPETTNPARNQQEDGVARRSPSGAALQRNAARLVRQMEPLYNAPKYQNQIGITLVQNAKNIPLVYTSGYDGILPMTEQPKVDKPYPYQ